MLAHLDVAGGAQVALDAANEAFNASAGRLRKLYAVAWRARHVTLGRG